MKNFTRLATALLLCISTFTYGQNNYGIIEWDILGIGMVIPSGDGVTGGISLHSEPRFNIKDNFSIGARYQVAILGTDIDDDNAEVSAAIGLAAFGDYYLNAVSNRRSFIGLGIGVFSGGTFDTSSGGDVESGSSLGVIPRLGYELGLIRLTGEYNWTLDNDVPNYLGINLGLTIGGRYRG